MGNRKLNRRQGGSIEHAIAAPFVAAVMTNSLQVNPRRRRSGNRYGLRQAATWSLRSKWMALRHGEKWLGCIPAI
jgi:hypothetical protein